MTLFGKLKCMIGLHDKHWWHEDFMYQRFYWWWECSRCGTQTHSKVIETCSACVENDGGSHCHVDALHGDWGRARQKIA